VVNIDDSSAQKIILRTKATVYTVGLHEGADIRPAGAVSHSIHGLAFSIATPKGPLVVESPLMGEHNVYNILCAVGVGLSLGFDRETITRGINTMKAVPGRMEKVDLGQPFGVIVDYAHTEDSLKALLGAVRPVTKGRVITLFGCGGDRDRTKRPKMGAAALSASDIVIVTTDNPRTEDPLRIIEEIETGMRETGTKLPADAVPATVSGKKPYVVVPERREAISIAVRIAGPGDTVVLAGKGHETYQIIGDTKIHFDDREIAQEALRMRRSAN
jgi:UDP-N-acetylmuramoyl-L-alanyl-D-glutamate--2,6-diaminopimelate ligase